MPEFSEPPKKDFFTLYEDFLESITRLDSKLPVRPVVTRSGKRARGNFPSIKSSTICRYESLVERDLQRVCEVSTLPKHITAHPYVLSLSANDKQMRYTPDLEIRLQRHGLLVEAKGEFFLHDSEQRDRLKKIIKALKKAGVHYVIAIESDIRPSGLQDELEDLLWSRPPISRYRPHLNKDPFDPLYRAPTNVEVEKRWLAAQAECDALLSRLMRRDPDDLVSSFE